MSDAPPPPAAVVVGLCAHGLGLVRDLHRSGVRVIALESDRNLPGCRTREAEVHWAADINGGGLVTALLDLADTMNFPSRPVLILTNDRMVEILGTATAIVSDHYRLSWSDSAAEILRLQKKDRIEGRCRECGLNYPRSVVLEAVDGLHALPELKMPVIFKPTRPLSEFKTLVAASPRDLGAHAAAIARCLPVLAQEFIAGDDSRIHFGALYLDRGRVLARFEGRKLYSRPMGHTTIAVSEPNDHVHELTTQFFDGLGLSGPVSLELKRDPEGEFWVIEPTVGRTDFWVGLCSANGVNLALIEYLAALGKRAHGNRQLATHVWLNGERHPAALIWLWKNAFSIARRHSIRGVYVDLRDPMPLAAAAARQLARLPGQVARKLAKAIGRRRPSANDSSFVSTHHCVAELPADAKSLLDAAGEGNVEFDAGWFENLQNSVFPGDPGVRFLVQRQGERLEAVLPIRLTRPRGARRIDAFANYYTSLYAPALAPGNAAISLAPALAAASALHGRADVMEFRPLDPDSPGYEALLSGLSAIGWKHFRYFCFGNWYLKVDQPWAQYLRQRHGALRNTLKRKGRKFAADGGRLEVVSDPAEAESAIQAFNEVYARSWKNPEPFPKFIPGLIRWLAATGRLRLGLATLGDRPVAAQIWIVNQARAAIYKLAYDADSASYAPGTLLTAHLMEHVIDLDGVREVDYLIGDDEYKQSWMNLRRERWGIIAFNPHTLLGQALLWRERTISALRIVKRMVTRR